MVNKFFAAWKKLSPDERRGIIILAAPQFPEKLMNRAIKKTWFSFQALVLGNDMEKVMIEQGLVKA